MDGAKSKAKPKAKRKGGTKRKRLMPPEDILKNLLQGTLKTKDLFANFTNYLPGTPVEELFISNLTSNIFHAILVKVPTKSQIDWGPVPAKMFQIVMAPLFDDYNLSVLNTLFFQNVDKNRRKRLHNSITIVTHSKMHNPKAPQFNKKITKYLKAHDILSRLFFYLSTNIKISLTTDLTAPQLKTCVGEFKTRLTKFLNDKPWLCTVNPTEYTVKKEAVTKIKKKRQEKGYKKGQNTDNDTESESEADEMAAPPARVPTSTTASISASTSASSSASSAISGSSLSSSSSSVLEPVSAVSSSSSSSSSSITNTDNNNNNNNNSLSSGHNGSPQDWDNMSANSWDNLDSLNDNSQYNSADQNTAVRFSFNGKVLFINLTTDMNLNQVKNEVINKFDIQYDSDNGDDEDEYEDEYDTNSSYNNLLSRIYFQDRHNACIDDGRTAIASGAGHFIKVIKTDGGFTNETNEVVDNSSQKSIIDIWADTVKKENGLKNLFLKLASDDADQAAKALSFVRMVNQKIRAGESGEE